MSITFKGAFIILIALFVVSTIIYLAAIITIEADVESMRKEYLQLIKDENLQCNRYLKEWGVCIQKWEDTLKLNSELLEIIKCFKEGD